MGFVEKECRPRILRSCLLQPSFACKTMMAYPNSLVAKVMKARYFKTVWKVDINDCVDVGCVEPSNI